MKPASRLPQEESTVRHARHLPLTAIFVLAATAASADDGPNRGRDTVDRAQDAPGIAASEFNELIRAIRAGATYANVHSSLFPPGEIRGQIRDSHDH